MKNYFTFSKGQKIGVTAIAICIVGFTILLNKENKITIPDPFMVDVSQYQIMEDDSNQNKYFDKKVSSVKYSLQSFDPNMYKVSDWEKIGFSAKQAKSIVSFKNKLKGFKRKEDLKKSFVIDDAKYAELEPYIQIDETYYIEPNSNNKYIKETNNGINKEVVQIELNSANKTDLVKIKGIGEYTAGNILKYKKEIGGYHSVIQLKEVYGISDENYELIIPQISINSSNISKINVNVLSISDLKKHPYISWGCAKAIIDQRFKGKLTSIQFLLYNDELTQDEIDNLIPYIEY